MSDPLSDYTYLHVINDYFQLNLMKSIRQSILDDRFPEFVKDFMNKQFLNKKYPEWAVEALSSVGIHIS